MICGETTIRISLSAATGKIICNELTTTLYQYQQLIIGIWF